MHRWNVAQIGVCTEQRDELAAGVWSAAWEIGGWGGEVGGWGREPTAREGLQLKDPPLPTKASSLVRAKDRKIFEDMQNVICSATICQETTMVQALSWALGI